MRRSKTFAVAAAALVGAAYAALTVLLAPISYGPIQLRISELLCILPFFMPCSVWGLFLGCALANLMTGNVYDIVFGSLATLFAARITARLGKKGDSAVNRVLACLAPVVINALIIGAVVTCAYNGMSILCRPGIFAFNALQLALGEGAVMLLGGLPLMKLLPKSKFFRELVEKTR